MAPGACGKSPPRSARDGEITKLQDIGRGESICLTAVDNLSMPKETSDKQERCGHGLFSRGTKRPGITAGNTEGTVTRTGFRPGCSPLAKPGARAVILQRIGRWLQSDRALTVAIERGVLERVLTERPGGTRSTLQAVKQGYAEIGLLRELGVTWAEIAGILGRNGAVARGGKGVTAATVRAAFFLVGAEIRQGQRAPTAPTRPGVGTGDATGETAGDGTGVVIVPMSMPDGATEPVAAVAEGVDTVPEPRAATSRFTPECALTWDWTRRVDSST